ncbi:hypothetical protein Taro_050191 [Colocasia esculenta]|uniref:Uncharacterized protein n=1 Tax=Colocasia esculenta TaxID=4460 RepID=A0A843XCS6_COLES|nr:hypothetical protein [Colocasia esculenta]
MLPSKAYLGPSRCLRLHLISSLGLFPLRCVLHRHFFFFFRRSHGHLFLFLLRLTAALDDASFLSHPHRKLEKVNDHGEDVKVSSMSDLEVWSTAMLGHILSTSCVSISERSCDLEHYRRQHRWTPTIGWRQSPWTLTQVGVHLHGRLHAVGGLIPGRQQGLPGLRNYPEIPAHLHHSLGHATNDPQKTTELSFGRPKEEKLKSHHHPQRKATAPT